LLDTALGPSRARVAGFLTVAEFLALARGCCFRRDLRTRAALRPWLARARQHRRGLGALPRVRPRRRDRARRLPGVHLPVAQADPALEQWLGAPELPGAGGDDRRALDDGGPIVVRHRRSPSGDRGTALYSARGGPEAGILASHRPHGEQ